MDQRSAPLSPDGLAHYRHIWERGVRYLTLKYANLPVGLSTEERDVM